MLKGKSRGRGAGDIIILVVSISWLYQCNIIYKYLVKHSIVGQLYVLLALSPCVLIQKYLLVVGLDLSFGVLASFNITDSDRPSRHIKLMMSWPSSSVDIDRPTRW